MIVAADVVLAVIMTVQKKRTALSNSLPSTFASAGNPATAEFFICLKKGSKRWGYRRGSQLFYI